MKKSFRFMAVLLATMLAVTGFAFSALAAPSSNPVPATGDEAGYSVTFTVSGNGKVLVYKTIGGDFVTEIAGGTTKTIVVDHAIKFTTDPVIDIEKNVTCNDPQRAVLGNYYYITPSRDSSVTVNIPEGTYIPPEESKPEGSKPEESDPETSKPEGSGDYCTLFLVVNSGGSVKVGEETVLGGDTESFGRYEGETVDLEITADPGYTIKSLKVGSEDIAVSGTSFTHSMTVSGRATVIVEFIADETAQPPVNSITVADIPDWSSDSITIDVSGGKLVSREVLDKISTLAKGDGKYVEFVSENGSIYIPYGSAFSGTSATVDMSIVKVLTGAEYTAISANFAETDIKYSIYKINTTGNLLPENTMVSFKLGTVYAGEKSHFFIFDGANLTLKTEGTTAVSASGVTEKYVYNNEPLMVCTNGIPDRCNVEVILSNVGGNAAPNGVTSVNKGEKFEYTVTVAEGYTIKQILVNGTAVEEAAGQTRYMGVIESVEEDYTVSIEFMGTPVVEDDGGSSGTVVVVVLVIVFVALLGAAALFIVKWRQEKF